MKTKSKSTKSHPLGAFDPRAFGPEFDRGEMFSLDKFLEYFSEENNPTYLWMIRAFCRRNNQAVPERVEQYLDDVGERLIELADRKDWSDRKAATEVYRAHDMSKSGSHDPFDRYQIAQRNRLAIGRVNVRKMRGERITHALKKVAKELSVEYSLLRDVWYRQKGK